MTNPFTRSAATNWPNGPNAGTDNFSSLANGACKCLGVLSPGTVSAPWGDIILPSWKITLASGPTTGNTIKRYLFMSEDNSVWPGGINPTSSSDQSSVLTAFLNYNPSGAQLIDQVTVSNGVTAYELGWVSIRGLLGNVPTYCTIAVYNQSGVAFAAYSSSNQVANYATDSYN